MKSKLSITLTASIAIFAVMLGTSAFAKCKNVTTSYASAINTTQTLKCNNQTWTITNIPISTASKGVRSLSLLLSPNTNIRIDGSAAGFAFILPSYTNGCSVSGDKASCSHTGGSNSWYTLQYSTSTSAGSGSLIIINNHNSPSSANLGRIE